MSLYPEDVSAVNSDDELLDRLAAGAWDDSDPAAALLGAWRGRLDEAWATRLPDSTSAPQVLQQVASVAVADEPAGRVSGNSGRRRVHRPMTVLLAATVVTASVTGMAAAVDRHGPLSSLTRAIGQLVDPADPNVAVADAALAQTRAAIRAAAEAGPITPATRAALRKALDAAATRVAAIADARDRTPRLRRLTDLRHLLASIPVHTADEHANEAARSGDQPGKHSARSGEEGTTSGRADTADSGRGSRDGGGASDSGRDGAETSGGSTTSGTTSGRDGGSTTSGTTSGRGGRTDTSAPHDVPASSGGSGESTAGTDGSSTSDGGSGSSGGSGGGH